MLRSVIERGRLNRGIAVRATSQYEREKNETYSVNGCTSKNTDGLSESESR